MRFEAGIFRSRVARRIFKLFVLFALLPLGALLLLSFSQVTGTLAKESQVQLRHLSKFYAMSLYERLSFTEDRLRLLSAPSGEDLTRPLPTHKSKYREFEALGWISQDGKRGSLIGDISAAPPLTARQWEHLRDTGVLLAIGHRPGGRPRIFLTTLAQALHGEQEALIAEINTEFLLGGPDALPYMSYFCVLGTSHVVLFCSHDELNWIPEDISEQLTVSSSGRLHWTHAAGEFLAGYWTLFLEPRFLADRWTVIAAQPAPYALGPLASFNEVFVKSVIAAFLLVLLLSISQIRRSLVPLERLIEGTRRIANRDFSSRVNVASDDEFGELARAFNVMASRLGRQFQTLTTLSQVDRLILSTFEIQPVIEMVLGCMHGIITCRAISITLVDRAAPSNALVYVGDQCTEAPLVIERVILSPEDTESLLQGSEGKFIDSEQVSSPYLQPLTSYGVTHFFVRPIVVDGQLSGIISLGYLERPELSEDDEVQVGDFAERLAVALSSAEREERLYHQAYHDTLTALPNRQLFKEQLAQELGHAHRESYLVGVLFIDLDRFKKVNDSFGHVAGDRLLEQAATRLRTCTRETDTVARLGGDEFAVILPQISTPQKARVIAQHIIDRLSEPFSIGRHEAFVGASIGVTIYPCDGDDGEALLKNADTAMYRAKQHGRGRSMFFTEDMNTEALERVTLEADLRHALARDDLFLVYHPQVDSRSGRVIAVEALARWHHPEKGPIPPKQFIAIAEDSGLVETIGNWVLHTACAEFLRWRAEGIAPARIAVNVSTRQLKQTALVDSVRELLATMPMPSASLELEITESLLIEDVEEALSTLNQLHRMGVRLAIDDFGTGFSSMAYLRRFEFDVLKIDRSFIQEIGTGSDAGAIPGAIIAMAHSLNKEVIAEGVETLDQLTFLRECGCDLLQGYYFGEPMTARQLVRFLGSQAGLAQGA